MIKYFHELTEKEFIEVRKTLTTWAECAKEYPQPEWCSYPNAVCGMLGCWALTDFWITGRKDCTNCDCYIKKVKHGS